MPPLPVKVLTIKTRCILISGLLLMSGACQANDPTKDTDHAREQQESKITQISNCPLVSDQNWSAQIKTSNSGESTLYISGDIELPSPGYSVAFEEIPADNNLEPSQHFNLKTETLSGFYIQAVTPMTLQHTTVAIADKYRAIVISCDGKTLATINDVTQNK